MHNSSKVKEAIVRCLLPNNKPIGLENAEQQNHGCENEVKTEF